MRKMAIPAAATALLLAGAGCGGGSDASGSTSAGDPTTTTSSPSPSEPIATNEQYASIVALKLHMAKTINSLQNNCNWISSGPLDRPGSIACFAGLPTVQLESQDLALRLRQAMTPTSKAFLGAPPDEIASLVQATLADARTLARASGQADDHNCAMKGNDVCLGLRGDVFRAMGSMAQQLSGWRPYM
jgi:hypothetical protein